MRRSRSILSLALVASTVVAFAPAPSPAATDIASDNPWLAYAGVMNSAHRGGAFEAPENTLFAFREAMLRGADQLETDVAFTADGEIVVIHDTTVDRTTDGSGAVADLTLAEVQALDAGYCFEPGGYRDCKQPLADDTYPYRGVRTGEVTPPAGYTADWFRIPTLREVLETFPGVPLNVEIKATNDPQVDQGAAAAVADLLKEYDRSEDVIVVSFDDTIVLGFKANAPEISTAPGLGQGAAYVASAQGPAPGAPGFGELHDVLQFPRSQFGVDVVTEDLVADAHAGDLAVHVFTIDDRDAMAQLTDIGVDSIMTNRSELLEQVLVEAGRAYETPAHLIPACPDPSDPRLDGAGCNTEAYAPGTFG